MRFALGEGNPAFKYQLVNILVHFWRKNPHLDHGRCEFVEKIFIGDSRFPDIQESVYHTILILPHIRLQEVQAE